MRDFWSGLWHSAIKTAKARTKAIISAPGAHHLVKDVLMLFGQHGIAPRVAWLLYIPDAWIAVSMVSIAFSLQQRKSGDFWGLNCAKSRPNFYDAERLLLFGFATCALATLASRPMIAARRLFGLAADPAVAIRINVVQSRCNRSVLK
jgi:hypothetical protein